MTDAQILSEIARGSADEKEVSNQAAFADALNRGVIRWDDRLRYFVHPHAFFAGGSWEMP